MELIKINHKNPNPKAIEKAVNAIKRGGLVIYPTDTAYGIAVNAYDQKAIKKLYRLKNRRTDKPTHVVVRDWDMIRKLTIPNKTSKTLFEKLLPGPLTMILKKRPCSPIPGILTGGLSTLGVKIPDNLTTQSLSGCLHLPYTTPSANRTGEQTPYSISDVKNVLDVSKVDLILDAGTLPENKPSTIIDLSEYNIKILREGNVSANDILDTISKN
ncbi:threonylcarbamoyl-AMP synthase [Candidatus Woesebacteria bacterium]|nr:threonylcarbamoyl-AMP synthase [Candidatus Woesebacteria bacterium]